MIRQLNARNTGRRTIRTIGVLLPSVKLIVDGQRHTLLESTVGVGRPADDVASQLKTKRHVEIFGHIRLRPDLLLAIRWVSKGRILECLPPEERVVADERCNLAVGAT